MMGVKTKLHQRQQNKSYQNKQKCVLGRYILMGKKWHSSFRVFCSRSRTFWTGGPLDPNSKRTFDFRQLHLACLISWLQSFFSNQTLNKRGVTYALLLWHLVLISQWCESFQENGSLINRKKKFFTPLLAIYPWKL